MRIGVYAHRCKDRKLVPFMLDLQYDVDLTACNTFGFRVVAERFIRIDELGQLPPLCDHCEKERLPLLLLGGGSNLVLSERLPGVVAQMALSGWRVEELGDGESDVTVGAGVPWPATVERALDEDLYGLENLAMIPGTVGAAPVQNIGAYGVELKDRVRYVEGYDRHTRQFIQLSQADCAFRYRGSVFKANPERYIITAVHLRLSKTPALNLSYAALEEHCRMVAGDKGVITPRHVFTAVCQLRQSKLPEPAEIGSAGSFFQNPVVSEAHYRELKVKFPSLVAHPDAHGYKLAAGWLIEQCGWKGKRLEQVGVYEKQALVLVNLGGGDRAQIERLATAIQVSVQERFGVLLEPEPRFYP